MIILDATTKSLEAVLGGAVTTNELPITVHFADRTTTTFTPGEVDVLTAGATPVTILAAPAASTQRKVEHVSVFNKDTAAATITVRYNNGGTIREMIKVVLSIGDNLHYIDAEGWFVVDSTGARKGVGPTGATGPTGPSGPTGPIGPAVLLTTEPDEPNEPFMVPGVQGPAGPAGAPGAQGTAGSPASIIIDPEEPAEPLAIPGPAGPEGPAGGPGVQGPPGQAIALIVDPETPDEPIIIPGPAGPAGAAGATITRVAGASGAAGADFTFLRLTANSPDVNTTALSAAIMTLTGVGAGTWLIRAYLIYQSATATNGIGIGLNHTGTVGQFQAHWFHVSTGGAAATGVGDSDTTIVGGQMAEGKHDNALNAVIGSTSGGVDTINADILLYLNAIMVVTATGSLELKISSELGGAGNEVRIMANSILELIKVG